MVTSEDEASRPQVQEKEDGASRLQVLALEDQGHGHTTMTLFWRPQHLQKTEIDKEKEKENRIKK